MWRIEEGAFVARHLGVPDELSTFTTEFRMGEVTSVPRRKGIVEVADERHASLIVLGSPGRSGLADVLIGRVAQGSLLTLAGPCSSSIAEIDHLVHEKRKRVTVAEIPAMSDEIGVRTSPHRRCRWMDQ